MKKIGQALLIAVLLIMQAFAVSALTAGEAKDAWLEARSSSLEKQEQHREAKLLFAENKSDENRQNVVDTGKEVLHAALDEVEAWLTWKELEAKENPEVPDDIIESIENDVAANKAKIEGLRTDVDGVNNQLGLGLVFLKMIGKYTELLADVARNSGAMWVHIANTKADTIEEYEARLRGIAEGMDDNEEILATLDKAVTELEVARRNIDNAESVYDQVRVPGTPLLKFSEGNNYLKAATGNLILAHGHLNKAYLLMM
ncbi:MAG: hypothetical protein ABIB71_09105 [Candidatus Woesearchaeota archaeon]